MKPEFVLQELLQRNKFEFAFMGLIFGTIALSFQFSPQLGNGFIWILSLSWLLYLASASIGAYRLYKIISYANLYELDYMGFIIDVDGKVTVSKTLEGLKNKRNDLDKQLKFKFKLQFLYYFIGLILNGVFAILIYRNQIFIKCYSSHFDWVFSVLSFLLILILTLILICIDKKNKRENTVIVASGTDLEKTKIGNDA